ncbi:MULTISPECIES: 5-oxoprolinase subunit PxpB [Bacillaceae]|uniref:5-oxoprolinase subunit PxpB n=1 Tax=Evansella alkalicola TaxID=745819 RepID=A0ABS6JN08_9BACI|nr:MULTISPECIES: 5-oxoprolinase subunit PxpB [Bacillaceae]MBU9719942.1 5-oxoprolinase subunit PxpB [Bacillus alkalicola]
MKGNKLTNASSSPTIKPLSDIALLIEFYPAIISEEINDQVHQLAYHLENVPLAGVTELVPAYSSLAVFYNPLMKTYDQMKALMEERLQALYEKNTDKAKTNEFFKERRLITIPVLYGGELGPDIEIVAEHNQLSIEEVVKIHTSREYRVYMMGFSPGFPYLGGMSEEIATPRHEVPRVKVQAGSVGIAGSQTGIYPLDSPGGWQIIGKTPVPLFNISNFPKPHHDPHFQLKGTEHQEGAYHSSFPVLIRAGDTIRFTEIDEQEFDFIMSEVQAGSYQPMIEKYSCQGGE